MNPVSQPRLRKKRGSGVVVVKLRTPRGIQWISTGTKSLEEARKLCTEAKVGELQAAASANALTADVISRLTTGRRSTMADLLAAWKIDAVLDLAPDTLAGYERALQVWFKREDSACRPISAMTRDALDRFVNEPSTKIGVRRNRLAAVRSLFKFASATGSCIGNLALRCKVNTRDMMFEELERRETIPFTEVEYRKIMDCPKTSTFWTTATALAYWLGYRLRDCACLEWASIQGDRIVIYPRKTRRRLELDLDDPLIGSGELRRIFLSMLEQPANGSPYCFPKEREMAMSTTRRAGLSVYFSRVLQRVGIAGKHFHGLRHLCAVRLKAAGWTTEDVQHVLGHASAEITKIYTEHQTEGQISEEAEEEASTGLPRCRRRCA